MSDNIVDQIQKQLISIEENLVGISNVTFDATNIFVPEQNIIQRIEVNFVFTIPSFSLRLQTFSLDQDNPAGEVSIQAAIELATEYSYILTYHFCPECLAEPYTSNVKTSNALVVNIDGPAFEQMIPIIVFWGDDPKNNPDFVHFIAKIHYEDPPYFPNIPASKILPAPDLNTPLVITIDSSTTSPVINKLLLFANNNLSPLRLFAQAVRPDKSRINWGPFHFNPADTASLAFSKNYQFVYVSIDPINVNWEINAGNASLVKIDLLITAAHYVSQNTQCTMPLGKVTFSTLWDPQKQKAPCMFYEIPNLPVDYSDMAFDWIATYVYKSGVKYASGTQQGITLILPTAATASFYLYCLSIVIKGLNQCG